MADGCHLKKSKIGHICITVLQFDRSARNMTRWRLLASITSIGIKRNATYYCFS